MTKLTRRSLLIASGACATAAATPSFARSRSAIDKAVEDQLQTMQSQLPFTQNLVISSAGMLVIPRVTKGGLMVGGAYGEGALVIGSAPVDYYSVAAASFGFQIGLQRMATALFFMTPERLAKFRRRDGWTLGADLEYTLIENGETAAVDSNTYKDDVFAVVFSQKGLLAGASIEGSKYSRIVR
jgi:lipid-binding SYLF domain-containing protein